MSSTPCSILFRSKVSYLPFVNEVDPTSSFDKHAKVSCPAEFSQFEDGLPYRVAVVVDIGFEEATVSSVLLFFLSEYTANGGAEL